MSSRVAITGMGIISSIGKDVNENYISLSQNRHGISIIENIETQHKNDIMVGEIKFSNDDLSKQIGLPLENDYSRTALLGIIAIRQAVSNANITDINNCKTGLITATSVGGMDIKERYFYQYFEDESVRRYINSHNTNDVAHKIANSIGLKGLVTTVSTACSSAANAIMMGVQLIQSGRLERVIVGGTDALSKFTINGFKTLMILSDTYCQPFDDNRKGLNLGEAAAYLILESDVQVQKNGKIALAYVSGYGNANDAYHQTASSDNGEGAYLSMKKALAVSGIKTTDVDYINAHGTATPNNDLSEARAITRVFGKNVPCFSSTKAFTGHTLAAAAAIEAVYSILALQKNSIYANLNFQTPMSELPLLPNINFQYKNVRHVLSNSFGFGGNCSTLIFSK